MARAEARLGAALVGQTYVSLGQVASNKRFNVNLNFAGALAGALSVYVAASAWASGEPAGAELVGKVASAMPVGIGDVGQISGFVMHEGEKLVVRSTINASIECYASGVESDEPA